MENGKWKMENVKEVPFRLSFSAIGLIFRFPFSVFHLKVSATFQTVARV